MWILASCQPVFPMFDTVDNLADVPNRNGMVAAVRRTRAMLPLDTPIPYYVFVHPKGTADRNCNLFFQYDATDSGWRDGPRVSRSGSTLRIVVRDRRDIARVVEYR